MEQHSLAETILQPGSGCPFPGSSTCHTAIDMIRKRVADPGSHVCSVRVGIYRYTRERGQKYSRGDGIVETSHKVTCSLPYIQRSHAEVLTVVCAHVGTEVGAQRSGPMEAAP